MKYKTSEYKIAYDDRTNKSWYVKWKNEIKLRKKTIKQKYEEKFKDVKYKTRKYLPKLPEEEKQEPSTKLRTSKLFIFNKLPLLFIF